MFEWCSITVMSTSSPWRDVRIAPGARDQVDAFGRVPGEDDFVRRSRADERAHDFARALVGFRRALAQPVHAAMHVGVVVFVVSRDRFDDLDRLLRRRRVVEIDQRLAVDLLVQRREVARGSPRRRTRAAADATPSIATASLRAGASRARAPTSSRTPSRTSPANA